MEVMAWSRRGQHPLLISSKNLARLDRSHGLLREPGESSILFLSANPAFHADHPVNRAGFSESVINLLAQRVQRHPAGTLLFLTGDIRTPKTARNLETDPFRSKAHRHLDRLLHRPAESDAAFELERNILRHKL